MQKWEYNVRALRASDFKVDFEEDGRDAAAQIQKSLNEIGQHGWEFVGSVATEHFLIFKRPKHCDGEQS